MNEAVTLRMEQDTDPNEGWLGRDPHRTDNGRRTSGDFEVDEYWSSTNTDFGGSDPGRVGEKKLEATFDPRNES